MNERDARLQKIVVIRKDMAFAADFVSCMKCACNYSMKEPGPGEFCQIYGITVDPLAVAENELKASACDQWVPWGMNRNKIVTPDHKYRYEEKD